MRRKFRSYTEVAAILGIERCAGFHAGILDLPLYDHEAGEIVGNVLHWRDRNVRRQSLWRFCLLVARMRHGDEWKGLPLWLKLYRESIAGYEVGLEIGVRFGREEMATRKLRTRSAIAAARIPVDLKTVARSAYEWARRED